jgi:predicted transcriptional regulator
MRKEHVTFRLEPDTKAKLEKQAKKRDRTFSDLLRWLIKHFLKNPEKFKEE